MATQESGGIKVVYTVKPQVSASEIVVAEQVLSKLIEEMLAALTRKVSK
jgi:hypothetical protein